MSEYKYLHDDPFYQQLIKLDFYLSGNRFTSRQVSEALYDDGSKRAQKKASNLLQRMEGMLLVDKISCGFRKHSSSLSARWLSLPIRANTNAELKLKLEGYGR